MILAKQHLMAKHKWRFRLLNSEIGNDQMAPNYNVKAEDVFVSLTRR